MVAAACLTVAFLIIFMVGKKMTSLVVCLFGIVWICLSVTMYHGLKQKMAKKWVNMSQHSAHERARVVYSKMQQQLVDTVDLPTLT